MNIKLSNGKAIGIVASPRKDGNTAILMEKTARGLEENLDIETIFLKNIDMSPCLECYSCVNTNQCAIEDGMQDLYAKLLDAKVLILASPVFMGGIASRLRIFMERTWPLRKGQLKDKIGSYIIVGRRDLGSAPCEMEEYLSRLKVNKVAGVLGFGLKKGEILQDKEAFSAVDRMCGQIKKLL